MTNAKTETSAKETGGPAFPVIPPTGENNTSACGYPFPHDGMTLRDWFAGQFIASNADALTLDQLAGMAYAAADAMLVERAR